MHSLKGYFMIVRGKIRLLSLAVYLERGFDCFLDLLVIVL